MSSSSWSSALVPSQIVILKLFQSKLNFSEIGTQQTSFYKVKFQVLLYLEFFQEFLKILGFTESVNFLKILKFFIHFNALGTIKHRSLQAAKHLNFFVVWYQPSKFRITSLFLNLTFLRAMPKQLCMSFGWKEGFLTSKFGDIISLLLYLHLDALMSRNIYTGVSVY